MTHQATTTLCSGVDVSRETISKLREYEALVIKWNKGINLISKASISDLWARHIVDSAQLFPLAGPAWAHWADLGSGGGFPGIVIAALASELQPQGRVTLVESDQRKAAFLRAAARELDLKVTVICDRIEKVSELNADIVSARALSDLSQLLSLAVRHITPMGMAIFPKGEAAQAEIDAAQLLWRFDLLETPSITQGNSRVLTIKEISRV